MGKDISKLRIAWGYLNFSDEVKSLLGMVREFRFGGQIHRVENLTCWEKELTSDA